MPTLNWMGKEKVVNHHRDVPYRVLKRVPEKGVLDSHGSDCGNMVIHGDNLEALKALLPEYEGRVDCVYIDPPYNTGEEKWVYNDNVNDPRIQRWIGEVVGKEGEDFCRHDKWLCTLDRVFASSESFSQMRVSLPFRLTMSRWRRSVCFLTRFSEQATDSLVRHGELRRVAARRRLRSGPVTNISTSIARRLIVELL